MGNPSVNYRTRVVGLETARQHGSLNRRRAEFSDRRIYSKISFSPAALWVGQLWLPVDTVPIHELLNPNPDTPDSCSLYAEPLV